MTSVEFCCPHCEASWFRTDARLNRGECKGCGFTWDRAQDWTVFFSVTRLPFRDDGDYQAEVVG
jgi:uncharacterized protein (DUF983 family)